MKFAKAIAIFLGTVIGVGIFGLPFVSAKAGFLVILVYFLVMFFVAMWMNFIYSDVILGTSGVHRFPGYVNEYMGHKWKNTAFVVVALGLIGSLLAYLIVGGQFLYAFLSPLLGGEVILYTLLFFAVGAFFIFRGIKSIAIIELILFFVLLLVLGLFFVNSAQVINLDNFRSINLAFLILPYGAVLFSLGGGSVIPEVVEILASAKGNKKDLRRKIRKLVILGLSFTVAIYLFFIYIVQGSSIVVSADALSGLSGVIDDNVIRLGFIFGVITCFTSFLALSVALKKTLWYDFKLSKNFSWFLTSFIPLGLFFLGFREFIGIIGFTGAVLFGLEGIILIFLYKKFLKKEGKIMNRLNYLLLGVFIFGIILSILLFWVNML